MKLYRRRMLVLFSLVFVVAVTLWFCFGKSFYVRKVVKLRAFNTLSAVQTAVIKGNSKALADLVQLSPALVSRTADEQGSFINKAFRGELTEEGLTMLRKEGQFGPLVEIFPEDGSQWARASGVRVEDCVALRLDRPTHRMEIAFATNCPEMRVIWLNNVRP